MKTTPIIIAVFLLVVVGIGVYYANRDTTTTTDTTDTTTQVPTTPTTTTSTPDTIPTSPTVTDINVEIRGFAFSPATLTIKKGTKVTWTNYDTAPHDVTSVSGSLLKSPRLTTGQSFSFTFTEPGTINYYCTIHPNMRATIVVTE